VAWSVNGIAIATVSASSGTVAPDVLDPGTVRIWVLGGPLAVAWFSGPTSRGSCEPVLGGRGMGEMHDDRAKAVESAGTWQRLGD